MIQFDPKRVYLEVCPSEFIRLASEQFRVLLEPKVMFIEKEVQYDKLVRVLPKAVFPNLNTWDWEGWEPSKSLLGRGAGNAYSWFPK